MCIRVYICTGASWLNGVPRALYRLPYQSVYIPHTAEDKYYMYVTNSLARQHTHHDPKIITIKRLW